MDGQPPLPHLRTCVSNLIIYAIACYRQPAAPSLEFSLLYRSSPLHLAGMQAHQKRLVLFSVALLTVVVAICYLFLLRYPDSSLSVSVRYIAKRMDWTPDTTVSDVFLRMSRYIEQGRYDDAVRIGDTWTAKNPHSESNVEIYTLICRLYLERAKADRNRADQADQYVKQAMLYRDKMLPLESNDVYWLWELALLSQAGGDLSAAQRCAQYRNAISLLERLTDVLREKRTVAPREEAFVVPRKGTAAEYVLTVEDIDARLERAQGVIRQVQEKLQKTGCQ